NGLADELSFEIMPSYRGFRGKVLRPDRQTRTFPREDAGGAYSAKYAPIQPSSIFTKALLANRMFDFHIPGRYSIDLETTNLLSKGRDQTPYPTAGTIAIDVGPRDPAKLAEICADLEQAVMNGPEAEGLEKATVLAHVIDPVAVPFVARLLRAKERHLM